MYTNSLGIVVGGLPRAYASDRQTTFTQCAVGPPSESCTFSLQIQNTADARIGNKNRKCWKSQQVRQHLWRETELMTLHQNWRMFQMHFQSTAYDVTPPRSAASGLMRKGRPGHKTCQNFYLHRPCPQVAFEFCISSRRRYITTGQSRSALKGDLLNCSYLRTLRSVQPHWWATKPVRPPPVIWRSLTMHLVILRRWSRCNQHLPQHLVNRRRRRRSATTPSPPLSSRRKRSRRSTSSSSRQLWSGWGDEPTVTSLEIEEALGPSGVQPATPRRIILRMPTPRRLGQRGQQSPPMVDQLEGLCSETVAIGRELLQGFTQFAREFSHVSAMQLEIARQTLEEMCEQTAATNALRHALLAGHGTAPIGSEYNPEH
uniref:uncharacterized protein n=1 Tax=Pristiophorus japonicus TaxID=55135 RepID=UPI00398E952D